MWGEDTSNTVVGLVVSGRPFLQCLLQKTQIPVLVEVPPSACGCKKYAHDALGDHVNTPTAHSGAKKTHDWSVEQLADSFRTTYRVKPQQVASSQGQ